MRGIFRMMLVCALILFAATGIFAQDAITLVPFRDPLLEVEGVIPEGWTAAGNGIYMRGESPADLTLMAIQAAAASLEQVIPALLPQLALTELPEAVEQVEANGMQWDVYQVDVPAGGIVIRVDLALANQDGRSYIVLMQTNEEEYDALHEAVFLPVLQSVTPLVEEAAEVAYEVEEVTFPGGAEGVTLAGTLTLPEGDGPFPVVVLVSGSGPQDRDENLAPMAAIKPFALIADALTNAGVAVLRYDDRGVGESTGDFTAALITDFVADASAAIDYLLTREDIDPQQIGLLGHSEGGLSAAYLGANNPNLAFVIGMAPPAVTGLEVMIEQNMMLVGSEAEAGEITEEELATYRDYIVRTLSAVAEGDLETAEQLTRETYTWMAENSTAEELAAAGYTDADQFVEDMVPELVAAYENPWYQELLNWDAFADWAQVTIPTLGLFGGKDVQVVADQNAPAMEAALQEAGNEDFEVITFPNANHLFQEAVTGAIREYGTLEPVFTPDFLPTLINWITARVSVVE